MSESGRLPRFLSRGEVQEHPPNTTVTTTITTTTDKQNHAQICRVKNKFTLPKTELVGGYRDLMFCVLFEVRDFLSAP